LIETRKIVRSILCKKELSSR